MEIVDSCGSFPNVPLLGTKGGINYYLILARSHLGYPIRDKPNNIHLSGFFLKQGEDYKEAKEEIAKAWRHTHRKSRKDLGTKMSCFFGALSLVDTSKGNSAAYAILP